MSLTHLTYHILLSLADASRHGYGILKEVEARSGSAAVPSTGALYLALQRMESEGLVEDAPAPPEETDSRRRYYRLTDLGRATAREESTRLEALVAVAREKRLLRGGAA